MKAFLFMMLLLLAPGAWGEVFRCEGPGGVNYTDQPCRPGATPIEVPDNRIGGRFNQNLPPAAPPSAPAEAAAPAAADSVAADSPCRFINSTNLRTYLARNQVVRGMTREQVLKAFGRPPETYPVPQETWVYHTDYYDKLYELTYVYFRDGCVEQVVYRKP